MDIVSIAKARNGFTDTIEKAVCSLGISFKGLEKIVIKPNLCNYLHPSTGATTDVRVVDALIKIIRMENEHALISVVESDSLGKLANIAFKILGYENLKTKYENIEIINLTRDKTIRKQVEGFCFRRLDYPRVFEDDPFFISVPKLKTFDGMMDSMTCALKNQYGCNPYPRKWVYHKKLSEAIYDLNKLFTPDLVLVDGIISMEGPGPSSGIPKRTDLIIGGEKPASVDVVASSIIGLPYQRVKHLAFALKKGGLGSADLELVGDDIGALKGSFLLPKKSLVKILFHV